MAPCAHAVRFVNDKPGKTVSADKVADDAFDSATLDEHFGRNIDDLGEWFRAPQQLLVCVLPILSNQVAGVRNGRNLLLDQVSRLVVDQRDERRNDNGDTFPLALGADSW